MQNKIFDNEKLRIDQSKLLKIKSKILSTLFNEKLGEFNNTTETERVKAEPMLVLLVSNSKAFPV